METKMIPIARLELNSGQVEGLPRNPRFIRDERFESLKKSISDAPEMMDMRSLIVVEHGEKYVVICGNMRLRACRDLGYKELPCYILPEDTPVEKLKEYTIKDNIGFGQTDWDAITTDWDTSQLEGWGLEFEEGDPFILDEGEDEQNYTRKIEVPTYEPSEDNPDIEDLTTTTKRDELLEEIDAADQRGLLTPEVRDFLRMAAERHVVYNYARIGDFYAHASREVQTLMENSALVIVDYDRAIENGFVQLTNDLLNIREQEREETEDVEEE